MIPGFGVSRPLRLLMPGALYHVVARGNDKRTIYDDDGDRRQFLSFLETVVDRYQLECHAYCLMSNHYHLVIRTIEPNLSSAMQYLNSIYAREWNRRHARVGHLFQGRFKAQLIQDDKYFLDVCRYVVLNPVRAGLINNPGEWDWSSYAATAGLTSPPWWLVTRRIVGARSETEYRAYRIFVAAGVSNGTFTEAIRRDIPIIGTDTFVASYRSAIEQAAHPTEVVRRDRTIGRPSLEVLFADVRDKRTRNACIREARERFGYRVSEIATHLSLHYASVSRIATIGPDQCRLKRANGGGMMKSCRHAEIVFRERRDRV